MVCGAEKTETAYLKGLRDDMMAATVSMKLTEKALSPDQVVTYARDSFDRNDFDEVWCVLDVDSFEKDGGKVTQAVAAAAKANINLAISNPCFEVWLLLHHRAFDLHCANCDAVVQHLRAKMGSYDKVRLDYRHFAGSVQQAVERARALDPTGKNYARNPSTSVWRLVTTVMEQQ